MKLCNNNNHSNKSIFKAQNLDGYSKSKHMHTHTHARTHTHAGTSTHKHSDYTKLNIRSLKRAANAQGTWNGMIHDHSSVAVLSYKIQLSVLSTDYHYMHKNYQSKLYIYIYIYALMLTFAGLETLLAP